MTFTIFIKAQDPNNVPFLSADVWSLYQRSRRICQGWSQKAQNTRKATKAGR